MIRYPELLQRGCLFSVICRRLAIPDGILSWLKKAKDKEDHDPTHNFINATIGVMRDDPPSAGVKPPTYYLKTVHDVFGKLIAQKNPELVYPYAGVGGLEKLRCAWRDWLCRKGGPHFNDGAKELMSLPLVTHGLTNALHVLGNMFIDPGDSVVTTMKRWENYDLIFAGQLGGRLIEYEAFEGQRWNIDGMIAALRKTPAYQKHRILILNFPFNPSGYMPSKQEAQQITEALTAEAARLQSLSTPLLVFLDDAYEGFVFDDNAIKCSLFYQMLGAHPNLIPIKIDGISKEFMWWGGRLGFLTFGLHAEHFEGGAEGLKTQTEVFTKAKNALLKPLYDKAMVFLRTSISNANQVAQQVMLELLSHPDQLERAVAERGEAIAKLGERLSKFKEKLAATDHYRLGIIKPEPCNAGFFIFLNIDPGYSAYKLAERLLNRDLAPKQPDRRRAGIGVVAYEDPERGINGIRITFASVSVSRVDELIGAIEEEMETLEAKRASL